MDSDRRKFGRGPRELSGSVDLINHYRLQGHHHFFCKKSLPLTLSKTHYLHNVVGDTEIRKGEGMELDQLFQNVSYLRGTAARIQPFDLSTLGEAFRMQEMNRVELAPADLGIPTISGKVKVSKDKEKKHKKHKDKDDKKSEHRHKDRTKDMEKAGHHNLGSNQSLKHHDKERRHEGGADIDNKMHKKNKHKSSKT